MKNDLKKEWKRIKGFPGYEISNYGKVRSYKRNIVIILKPAKGKYGLNICLFKEGKNYNKWIHDLVIEHFICRRPKGKICVHIDNNRYNNNVKNLKWITRKELMKRIYESEKIILTKEQIIERFYQNKPVFSNMINKIKFKYKLVKKYKKNEKEKDKKILKMVRLNRCNLHSAAKMLNVSREWVRQVITRCGYIVVKYLIVNNEILGEKIIAGKGKVRGYD